MALGPFRLAVEDESCMLKRCGGRTKLSRTNGDNTAVLKIKGALNRHELYD